MRDCLDAHRWIERMERVFVHLQVPENRKVGLATEFLEDEPLYWWTEVCGGDPGRFLMARVQTVVQRAVLQPESPHPGFRMSS